MQVQPGDRMPRDRVVVAAPEQVSSDLGEEVVILQLHEGVYFGLQSVAARVWQLLDEPRTVGEIEATILDEYEVEPDRWGTDLDRLIHELLERRLIEIRPPEES